MLKACFVFIVIPLVVFQTHTGPHGGVVKKAGNYYIEMVNSGNNFYCWLLDLNQKPIGNKNISCEVKFLYPDNIIFDAKPDLFGDDGFTTQTTGELYTCKITFNVMGESVSAMFDSTAPIVKEN